MVASENFGFAGAFSTINNDVDSSSVGWISWSLSLSEAGLLEGSSSFSLSMQPQIVGN